MARGIHRVRGTARGGLKSDNQSERCRLLLTAMAGAVSLVACADASAPPTLPPAPTLMVVTPTPGPPPPPSPGALQRYVVREGDTLSGIATRFGVSEEA